MLTSAEEVNEWLKTQAEIVIATGAFLAPVNDYLERCATDEAYAEDVNAVYQLHTVVQNWDEVYILQLLKQANLYPYYHPIRDRRHRLETAVTRQTIPSYHKPPAAFLASLQSDVDAMSDAMLALAKVPPPAFSVTLAAGTPFDAYLLISRLVENATDFIYIVDAYCDASLFSRYLFRAKDGVQVSVRTSPTKWNKKGWKEQFEEAEKLFLSQHPDYDREDRNELHARYLITETGGWRIDGSIKDVAVTKDCPIHTVTPEEREKVVADYFTESI